MARLVLTMKIWRGTDCKNEKKIPLADYTGASEQKEKNTRNTSKSKYTHQARE